MKAPCENDGSMWMVKYKHTVIVHKVWSIGLLNAFTNNLKKNAIDKMHPNEQYMIGKFDILEKGGIIDNDQMPHRDYPPILST